VRQSSDLRAPPPPRDPEPIPPPPPLSFRGAYDIEIDADDENDLKDLSPSVSEDNANMETNVAARRNSDIHDMPPESQELPQVPADFVD